MTLTELFEYTKEHDVRIDIRYEKHAHFFVITMDKYNIRSSRIIEPSLTIMSIEDLMDHVIPRLMDEINSCEEET